jgi:hypothetical protein
VRESDLTFGVEFEVYIPAVSADQSMRERAYDRIVRRLQSAGVQASRGRASGAWAATYDGSLVSGPQDGRMWFPLEMVSPILRGEDGLRQVEKVCAAMIDLGCEVNKTCGLHVHIGAGQATAKQMRNLAKMFLKYEDVFTALTPPSRRDSPESRRYCKPNLPVAADHTRGPRETQLAVAFARIDRASTPRMVAQVMNGGVQRAGERYSAYRYYRLNFQSLILHGTVEFRQAAGTTSADKSLSWIKLMLGFCVTAWSVDVVAPDSDADLTKLLRKVDRKTAAYLAARYAALNPQPAAPAATR